MCITWNEYTLAANESSNETILETIIKLMLASINIAFILGPTQTHFSPNELSEGPKSKRVHANYHFNGHGKTKN